MAYASPSVVGGPGPDDLDEEASGDQDEERGFTAAKVNARIVKASLAKTSRSSARHGDDRSCRLGCTFFAAGFLAGIVVCMMGSLIRGETAPQPRGSYQPQPLSARSSAAPVAAATPVPPRADPAAAPSADATAAPTTLATTPPAASPTVAPTAAATAAPTALATTSPAATSTPVLALSTVTWDKKKQLGSDGQSKCKYVDAAYSKGVKLCIRSYSDLVSNTVAATGDWAECKDLSRIWKSSLLDSVATESDTFLDIGANIGICTMHMAYQSDAKRIVAFEPSETNLFYVTGTLLANPSVLNRVEVYPVGLGVKAVDLPIYAEKGNAGHSVVGAPVKQFSYNVMTQVGVIPVRRLDDIIRPPYPNIRLVKIDVEGFETNVLQGGRNLFSSGAVRSVYFEVSPFLRGQNTSKLELINLFLEVGFEFKNLDGSSMHVSTLRSIVCAECTVCFANLFAFMAHHSPDTKQSPLEPCKVR